MGSFCNERLTLKKEHLIRRHSTFKHTLNAVQALTFRFYYSALFSYLHLLRNCSRAFATSLSRSQRTTGMI